ncbi:MAG: aspartate aminotransferase, partial [Candidatus Nanopelagicales bacterium]
MELAKRALMAEPFHAMAFGQRAAKLEAAGHRVIKLSLGEPDFGAPPAVRDAMRELMDGRPLPYTAALGLPSLRQAIAGFYRDRHAV